MPECKFSSLEVGVEEVTQDPHPPVVKGVTVTAGAAVGAIGM